MFSALAPGGAVAQVIYPGTMDETYHRLVLLMNPHLNPSVTHHPSVRPITEDTLAWNVWPSFSLRHADEGPIAVIDPRVEVRLNSGYPRGYNDGPAWAGKGANLVLTAGLSGTHKNLSYTFAPVVWVSQNASYTLVDSLQDKSPYSYQFERNIDWVQRYGDGAYASVHPGQSEVRLKVTNATLGVSSQNFTLGPGQLNHILMSNSGPGFYHFDLGTYRPQVTPVGDLELKLFWGLLEASDYFVGDPGDQKRLVSGFVFGWAPVFFDGLTASFHRVMFRDAKDLDFLDFAQVIYRWTPQNDTLNGFNINDLYDQLASVAFAWKLPDAGFEAYMEYALNDFNGNTRRVFTETEHTRAYTLGLLKAFPVRSDGVLTLVVEHTTLALPRQLFYRTSPSYYVHAWIEAGFTHKGQIVGAGIGPGGTSDYVGFTYYDRRGSLRFDIQRIRANEDYFARNVQDPDQHDTEFTFGLMGQRFFDRIDVTASLLYSYRFNRYFEHRADVQNLHVAAGVRVKL